MNPGTHRSWGAVSSCVLMLLIGGCVSSNVEDGRTPSMNTSNIRNEPGWATPLPPDFVVLTACRSHHDQNLSVPMMPRAACRLSPEVVIDEARTTVRLTNATGLGQDTREILFILEVSETGDRATKLDPRFRGFSATTEFSPVHRYGEGVYLAIGVGDSRAVERIS